MNIIDLFLSASFVVQLVILFLIFFSVLSWAIIFQKNRQFKQANQQIKHFDKQFWSTSQLNSLYESMKTNKTNSGTQLIFHDGLKEFLKLYHKQSKNGSVALAGSERMMRLAMNRELDQLEMRLSTLGTIGSISPYIGLFGTVYGIMGAFFALGAEGASQATLQMVAPHIGEALIATAVGLIVAIPAVIAYNRFTQNIRDIEQKYFNFIDEFISILQRETVSKSE